MPMTHASETDAINRLHFLTPVFGAGFSIVAYSSGMKIFGAENKRMKVILYSVLCYALYWRDIKIFDL